tara:strand:- start:476 stop:841 length:366 start_codon:yes stop_codon:yes gene_type:complete
MGNVLNSWLVTMNDGNQFKFSSDGHFKYREGEKISFDVNMATNYPIKTASKVERILDSTSHSLSKVGVTNPKLGGSKDDFILLQVCFKECMQAYGKDYEHIVLQKTEEFYDGLKEIYSRKN